MQQTFSRPPTKLTLAIMLPASTIAGLLVLLAPMDIADTVGNITVGVVASAAAALGITVALKQNTRHGFRPFLALAVGLALWATGELLWAYLTIVAGIEIPYPASRTYSTFPAMRL